MRRGDLFVLSWESLRRVEWGKVSSFLSMSGGGLFNIHSFNSGVCLSIDTQRKTTCNQLLDI